MKDTQTVTCLFVRRDRNGSEPPLVDIVRVEAPVGLLASDPSGDAVLKHVEDVVKSAYPDEPLTWNDVFLLPDEALSGHGIAITPVQADLAFEVGMDQEVGS